MDDEPLQMYLREVAKVKPLAREVQSKLFQQVTAGGDRSEMAERRLIEAHLSLVIPVAERYRSTGFSMIHLIQEGNLGLMEAVKEFSRNPAGDFSAFAQASIEGAISRFLANHPPSTTH